MAKYAISRKGIESLEALRDTLARTSEEIALVSEALINFIAGLENGLGIYYKEMLELTRPVLATLKEAKEGDDGLDVMTNILIPQQINRIEELINMGLGDEDDEPFRKKLVLRR